MKQIDNYKEDIEHIEKEIYDIKQKSIQRQNKNNSVGDALVHMFENKYLNKQEHELKRLRALVECMERTK